MDIQDYKKLKKLIDKALQETEKEAVANGVNLLSPEYDELVQKVKEKVVSNMGFNLEQYELIAEKIGATTKEGIYTLVDSLSKQLKKLDEKLEQKFDELEIPSEDKIAEISHEVAQEYIKPPEIIHEIVERTKVEVPIKETIFQTVDYNDEPLQEQLGKLSKRLDEIKTIDEERLREDLKGYLTLSLEENINTLGMPNFRKLAMGLQAQISAISSASSTGITGLISAGTNVTITGSGTLASPYVINSSGSGTITDVAIATANGFAGTSDSSTPIPTLTISTTETGLLAASGGVITGYSLSAEAIIYTDASSLPVTDTTKLAFNPNKKFYVEVDQASGDISSMMMDGTGITTTWTAITGESSGMYMFTDQAYFYYSATGTNGFIGILNEVLSPASNYVIFNKNTGDGINALQLNHANEIDLDAVTIKLTATTAGSTFKIKSGSVGYATLVTSSAIAGNTYTFPAQTGILVSTPDPNDNTIYMWDDIDGLPKNIKLGTGLSYDHTAHQLNVSFTGLGTDNHIVRWNGTNAIQDSTPTIGDSGDMNITIANNANVIGLTVTNNDSTNFPYTAKFIQVDGSGVLIETSADGSAADLELYNNFAVTSSNDIGSLKWYSKDSATNKDQMGEVGVYVSDNTSTSEDAVMKFATRLAGTFATRMTLGDVINGINVGSSTATGVISSSGNKDLQIQTGNATTGTLTLVNGANGNIIIAPNGTGKTYLKNASVGALLDTATIASTDKTFTFPNITGTFVVASAVNAVSPTSPNRTITIDIGGVTYYIHAKTTND